LTQERAAAERSAQQPRPTAPGTAAFVREREAARKRDGIEGDDDRAVFDRRQAVHAFRVGDDRLAVVEIKSCARDGAFAVIEHAVAVVVGEDAPDDDLARGEDAAPDANDGARRIRLDALA
jgi:hypothetical protein